MKSKMIRPNIGYVTYELKGISFDDPSELDRAIQKHLDLVRGWTVPDTIVRMGSIVAVASKVLLTIEYQQADASISVDDAVKDFRAVLDWSIYWRTHPDATPEKAEERFRARLMKRKGPAEPDEPEKPLATGPSTEQTVEKLLDAVDQFRNLDNHSVPDIQSLRQSFAAILAP